MNSYTYHYLLSVMYVTALASYVGSVLNNICGIRDFQQRHEW
jgi:hypothetical protein